MNRKFIRQYFVAPGAPRQRSCEGNVKAVCAAAEVQNPENGETYRHTQVCLIINDLQGDGGGRRHVHLGLHLRQRGAAHAGLSRGHHRGALHCHSRQLQQRRRRRRRPSHNRPRYVLITEVQQIIDVKHIRQNGLVHFGEHGLPIRPRQSIRRYHCLKSPSTFASLLQLLSCFLPPSLNPKASKPYLSNSEPQLYNCCSAPSRNTFHHACFLLSFLPRHCLQRHGNGRLNNTGEGGNGKGGGLG